MRALELAALLAISSAAPLVVAQPLCKNTDTVWTCFGIFELQEQGPARTIRMLQFSNGEFMAEIEGPDVKKQYLQVLPSKLGLYSGLTAQELPPTSANHPFTFLEYGFAYQAQALQKLYPAGVASIPEGAAERDVLLEENLRAKLTTTRESASRIRYRLVISAEASITMEGLWEGKLQDPLPDKLPVANWWHASSARFSSLGEARSLAKDRKNKD